MPTRSTLTRAPLLEEFLASGDDRPLYTALQNEKVEILVELGEIFANGDAGRKLGVLKLVASNATLESQKARLNLRSALALLPKIETLSEWLRGQDSNPNLRGQSPASSP